MRLGSGWRWLLAAFTLLAVGMITFALVYWLIAGKPRYGLLSARTDPPGAEVYVDGEKLGITPLDDRQVLAGPHHIRFLKENYFDLDRRVTILSGIKLPMREILEPIILVQLTPEELRRVREMIRKVQFTLTEKIHFPPPEDYNTLYFCREILKLDPGNQYARQTLRQLADDLREQAKMAFERGDLVEAEKILSDLARVEPQDTETTAQLDDVRQKVQQTRAARQNQIDTLIRGIDEAFGADRLCPPQPNNALDLLRELGQVDPRSRYVRGARLKLKDLLSERATRLAGQEDWNGAKTALATALQIVPNDADLSERLVQINKRLDEIAQAEQEKLRRQEQERQRVTRGQDSRRNGLAAYRNGNYERAIEELRQAGDIQGFDEEICYFMGASYLELRQPDRALTYFHDTLAANPNNASAHAQLGLLYLNRRKDFARAEEHFQRAQSLGGALGFDKNRLAQLIRDTRYQALLAKANANPIFVEHRHAFGSCQGTLTISGARIEYRTREGDHTFVRPPGDLRSVTFKDDGMEMRFDDKKYNFRFKNREDIQLVRELLKKS